MKRFLLYFLFLVYGYHASAQTKQPNPKREEKIHALYIAYITEQLHLTSGEAQQFWPVHAQYDSELRSVILSNSAELDKQQAVLNIKKKYQPMFNRIIGAGRGNDFYRKDAEFRQKLIERLKEGRQKRAGGRMGNR